MDKFDYKILRRMEWRKIEGWLKSLLETYTHNDTQEKYTEAKEKINSFIKDINSNDIFG